MMKNIEKPDFVAMVKKQAEKATPAITVLRPEREERAAELCPRSAHLTAWQLHPQTANSPDHP